MGWMRRSPVSIAALLVYLFAGTAGALHHHENDSQPVSAAAKANLHQDPRPETADGDEHTCAICTVLHQAKTQPILALLVAPLTHVREAVIIPAVRRPSSVATSTHARAPPAI